MQQSDPNTVQSVFQEAIGHQSRKERQEFLDDACKNDSSLRNRVVALLRAHDSAGDFLDTPAIAVDTKISTPLSEGPGTIIDKYKLLQLIGEGGFGAVYMAEQK